MATPARWRPPPMMMKSHVRALVGASSIVSRFMPVLPTFGALQRGAPALAERFRLVARHGRLESAIDAEWSTMSCVVVQ